MQGFGGGPKGVKAAAVNSFAQLVIQPGVKKVVDFPLQLALYARSRK